MINEESVISKKTVFAEDASLDDNVSKATSEVSNLSAIVPTEEELRSLAYFEILREPYF